MSRRDEHRSTGGRNDSAVLAFIQPRGYRWEEECGDAISEEQRRQLFRIARAIWGAAVDAEFKYWLACQGFYRIEIRHWRFPDYSEDVPYYVGSTRVIPAVNFEEVERELSHVKAERE